MTDETAKLAHYALEELARCGADASDVLIETSHSLSASCRLGAPELIERSESHDIGLRAIIGQRQAFVSAAGLRSQRAIADLAARAVAMAQRAPPDPWCGLCEAEALAKEFPSLELYDDSTTDSASLQARALELEAMALAEPEIANSEGASAGWGESTLALATSHGFFGRYKSSHWYLSCVVLAARDGAQERDYAGHQVRFAADLEPMDALAKRAAARARARLGAKKPPSQNVPVLYDKRVAPSLVRHLASAINGQAIARGTSFLKDALGEQVFADGIEIVDEPHRPRGLGSALFDAEGAAMADLALVRNGQLQHWLLDSASARQLQRPNTARAARAIGGAPHPGSSNLYLKPGRQSPDELRRSLKKGFLVTELIGMGVNILTGDYSRGAVGHWIENGELAWPVSEVTLAGNLRDMFRHLVPANDLEFRASIAAPSILVENMTLAGR